MKEYVTKGMKILLLLIAVIGLATPVNAQWPFDVAIPKCKFAKVIANDVNLRKKPDASSPRLVISTNNESFRRYLGFTNALIEYDEPARASILPIIGESGDWYHVLFVWESGNVVWDYAEAYIMKKFCEEVKTRPLELSAPNREFDVARVSDGKYAGLCLAASSNGEDEDYLCLGHYVNGMYAFAISYIYGMNQESDKTTIREINGSYNLVKFGKNLLSRVYDIDLGGFTGPYLSLDKLADDTMTLDLIMNSKGRIEQAKIYYGIEGDADWHVLDVSLLPEEMREVVHFGIPVERTGTNESILGKWESQIHDIEIIEEEEESDDVFMVVEEMPEFPGGTTELLNYLKNNVKYPAVAKENGIEGRVMVTFVVNKDGSICDVEIVKPVNPALDKEALRVVQGMPKWKPGMQRGKNVRVKFTLPVSFRLNSNITDETKF